MIERKPKMTAAELMASLQSDPEFVARSRARERKIRSLEAALVADERPLVQDLNAVGYPAGSVWDLVNTSADYERAIPVLVEHLGRPYSPKIREGIARALIVPKAKGVGAKALVSAFRNAPMQTAEEIQTKTTIGMAIATVADETVEGDVKEFLRDKAHGACRCALPSYFARIGGPEVDQLLIDSSACADPGMIVNILDTLLERNASGTESFVETMTKHPDKTVSRVAIGVLKKLNSASEKSGG